jgi:CRP/FNR family transcriptional regulator, polysaccharide utilization system transcription regulator
MDSERNCLDCPFKSPLFNLLSEEELKIVHENKHAVFYKKGETIIKQGTNMSHVLSVNTGLAKLYLEGPGNRNSIIRIVKPTSFVGGAGMYLDQFHHFTLTALMETRVCFIRIEIFKQLILRNKAFFDEFMKDFSRNVLEVYGRLLVLTQKQMPGRMADTLLYLFNEVFQSSKFILNLSKEDLADLSGMSKESAIKILRQFQKEKIINLTNNEIELSDPVSLQKISKLG